MAEQTVTTSKPTTTKPTYLDEDKNTTLHYCAAVGDKNGVMSELENGQKIDPENYLGWTPLMMAARNGQNEIVKVLLENRADSSRCNHFGLYKFVNFNVHLEV